MTRAVRDRLKDLANDPEAPIANAGLVRGRYLATVGDKNSALAALTERICGAPVPAGYAAAYARWERELATLPHVASGRFHVRTRLIVGLGSESARETGITLHRLYGVPLIPGSALKGVARHWAHDVAARTAATARAAGTPLTTPHALAPDGADARVLFGSQRSAAYVTWLDAWFIPDGAVTLPLRPDVMTPHHPDYIGSHGTDGNPPWDFDDPNPVPFLAATGDYLVAVSGPDADWATLALNLLARALAETGVGAKTSSGYGRLDRVTP